MKQLILVLLFFSLPQTFGQDNAGCQPMSDTLSVLRIARAKRFYPGSDTEFCIPVFDSTRCEWILTTKKIRYINGGRCRRLNGCTKIITITTVIDEQEKKVKSKTRDRKLYPHYE